jgi:hypothetical protein
MRLGTSIAALTAALAMAGCGAAGTGSTLSTRGIATMATPAPSTPTSADSTSSNEHDLPTGQAARLSPARFTAGYVPGTSVHVSAGHWSGSQFGDDRWGMMVFLWDTHGGDVPAGLTVRINRLGLAASDELISALRAAHLTRSSVRHQVIDGVRAAVVSGTATRTLVLTDGLEIPKGHSYQLWFMDSNGSALEALADARPAVAATFLPAVRRLVGSMRFPH